MQVNLTQTEIIFMLSMLEMCLVAETEMSLGAENSASISDVLTNTKEKLLLALTIPELSDMAKGERADRQ